MAVLKIFKKYKQYIPYAFNVRVMAFVNLYNLYLKKCDKFIEVKIFIMKYLLKKAFLANLF